ncbi:type II secretion system F family protein [Streptomyces sp. NBC_01257]|uniref:type II secretion system F family protein n=1 Tax=Streptomyces sp. NBC_01257 TaxID=2903799 RepID=UPI002DD7FEEF|nr:type II secretion system F family protein [Streptomyces sp. NBC_01257]WRZ65655.1 type II secretion system F family protein [Streptomyces sp. NBC_01257]
MSALVGEVVHRVGTVGLLLGACVQPALALARRRTERRVRRRGLVLFAEAPGTPGAGARAAARRGRWARASGVDRVSQTSLMGQMTLIGQTSQLGQTRPTGRMRLPGGAFGVGQWSAVLGAVPTGWILLGGPAGWAVGLAAGYGLWRWQRARLGLAARAAAEEAARTAESLRQLPLAADLLAACLSAGAGPREAAEAVGQSLGGPVGEQLARTAAEIRLGGDPALAWGRFGEIPGAAALARCLDRAGATGAPAAEPVARLAEAMRAERVSAAVARAQRAAVLITAPVGLCFLPAFLSVGVAPVVIGLAGGLLQS